ncbi:bifunctional hydroxymethylpyrimidine kinase/phosphomethylpyrimidine kinase [Lentibacillus cibarius]|uniref:pyridoxal kinase n=1 Tax=Lentibacillus cibarius TaxID=2583219 RepID=A0A5S3QKR2_9BACI|nr:bifunctional hydroxymethylpyrimidine kinase/phosphomethylpyrimidine kinase [Lentibacillus cibarius]TMN22530.1 bifunctional hydroxymethylpyrimidine kinase/phosphomethylpyrimidine kinase [Lentibacillus cibarius]
MNLPSRVITIAGSAAGGSAGIQADLKTFQELDVYGMSVVTALVARHPETDKNVHLQTIEAIEAQFATAVKQVGVDALKTGMLFSENIIDKAADLIATSDINTVVVDPVMVGKLDSKLLADDAIDVLRDRLLPMADVITPNVPEASYLLNGREVHTLDDMKQAAIDLHKLGPNYVLVKGGRLKGEAIDVLYDGETMTAFEAPRIDTENTSGAGCTYSAAITSYLAKGYTVPEAVRLAKSFVTTAIAFGFSYNDMVGPTYHAAERTQGEAHTIKVEKLA